MFAKTSLILLLVSASLTTFAAVQENLPVKVQVNQYAAALRKNIGSTKDNHEKFMELMRTRNAINAIRENNLTQTAADEGYMDLMVAVFDSLPTESSFKKVNCLKYENDLLTQFDPVAEGDPTEPAVKPGWAFLESLCH